MRLVEIAQRINTHLKRFEADPVINAPLERLGGLRPYYRSSAFATKSTVRVRYVSFQSSASLKKAEALVYLEWLDAGNVGRHYEALRI